jgi:PAS domain S-box-containing protein
MAAAQEASERLLAWDFFYLAHRVPGSNEFRIVGVVDTVEGRKQSLADQRDFDAVFSPSLREVLAGKRLLVNRREGQSIPLLRPLGSGRLSASLMFVPVQSESQVVGVLSAQSYTPNRYTESDLQILGDIADAIAPAMERIRTEESLRRSQRLLRLERDLVVSLSTARSMDEALDRLLDMSLQLEGIDCGGVYLADPITQDLSLVCHRNLSAGFVEHVKHLALDDQRTILASGTKAVYLATAELHAFDAACRDEGLQSLAVAPVTHANGLTAVLNLASRTFEQIPHDSRHAIEAIAAQWGASLVRLRAEQALREARDQLERRVQDRTAELLDANVRLRAEILDRRRAEQALRESEERYRAIVQDQTELICRFSADGRILFLNDVCCRYFGLSLEQVVGKPFFPLIFEEDRASVESQIASLSPVEPVVTVEERVRMADGSIRWYQWTNRGFFSDDGMLREVLAVGRDITERKQAEVSLREKEEQVRLLSENLADGMVYQIATGPDGGQRQFRYVSPAVERLHGVKPEDVMRDASLLYGRIIEEDQARLAELEARAIATRTTFDADVRIRHPSGEVRWHRLISSHRALPDGTLLWDGIELDITERKRVEEALRESEMKYRTVIETTGMGYNVVDTAGRVLDANAEYVRLTGRDSLAAILGRPVTDWTAPHDWERNAREVALCAAEGSVRHLEVDYIDRNGRITPVEVNATRTQTAEGTRIIAICRDITERRRVEAAMRENEEQLRALSENLADGMVYQIATGPDGQERRFKYLSPAAERLHDLKLEDARRNASLIYDQIVEEERASFAQGEARAIATRTTFDMDARVRLPSGEIRWRRFISSPRLLPDGNVLWDGIELDITERKKSEEALLRKELELRLLGVEANRRLEEERSRVSRELHDELGQILTALNLNLNWLGRRIGDVGTDILERIDESTEYVRRMIASVRTLSRSLRPVTLGHEGLVEAVRSHVAEFEQYAGIPCRVMVVPPDLAVSEPLATTAFRIVQEALTNVARHSKATRCRVAIKVVDDLLVLEIRDNGIGLKAKDQAARISLGIPGMRERAEIIGGTLTVANNPKGGVCVTARLPRSSPE